MVLQLSDFHPGRRCHACHLSPMVIAMPTPELALEYACRLTRMDGPGMGQERTGDKREGFFPPEEVINSVAWCMMGNERAVVEGPKHGFQAREISLPPWDHEGGMQ
jgi:hypothetical protein